MKKVLVTGSGGFLFSNFIRKALYNKSEYNFVTIDYCKGPKALNNIYVNKGHQLYVGDVADKHFVDVIFELERPDIVIHGAEASSHDTSDVIVHSNVLGTQTIADACVKWKTQRLIYISSDKVYGQLENDSIPSWKEESVLMPRCTFSASKAAGEMIIQAAHNNGLDFNIIRSCNTYGPRQNPHNFIPKVITSILSNSEISILGKGLQIREWIFVEDHCNAIMTILNEGKANEIYNVSSGHEFTNIEVFHELCNILERGHDLLKFVVDKPNHTTRRSLDSSKLRALGWKPGFKLRHGLGLASSWYEKNPWYWKR